MHKHVTLYENVTSFEDFPIMSIGQTLCTDQPISACQRILTGQIIRKVQFI